MKNPLLLEKKESYATYGEDRVDDSGNRWQEDLASEYDFCMVFPVDSEENSLSFTTRGKGYIRALSVLGFEIYVYKGVCAGHILVLVRAPIDKIRAFADSTDYKMFLDPTELQKTIEAGNEQQGIAGRVIPHLEEVTRLKPYELIYGKYSRQVKESLYFHPTGQSHPFAACQKLQLSALILESRQPDGGSNLKIKRYLRNGWLLGCFALHNRSESEQLYHRWKKFPFRGQPKTLIKNYFGEKIGLYFCFMEHYTRFLSVPAFVGIPLQIAIYVLDDYSAPFMPFYSFFLAVWAVFMLEFWKRKEKSIALEWGTIGYELKESDRPDYKGKLINSYVHGSEVSYASSQERTLNIFLSFLAISALIALILGIVVSIYLIRFALIASVGNSNSQSVASVLNAIQIQIMNYVYALMAVKLSENENHR